MDKKFKIFVVIALLILALLAATGTIVALSVANSANSEKPVNEDAQDSRIQIVALDEPITANLVGDERSRSIVRVSVGFGVNSKDKNFKDFSTKFSEKQLVIRNEIINILRAQTYEMMTRSDAQDKLSEEISSKINEILDTQIIKEVYFGEFFVQ